MLRFLTSGESHGRGLIGIIEGMPAGIKIDEQDVNQELQRRQKGYGRGGRMSIESDQVEIFAGVRNGITLGSPISFLINNRDFANWQDIMGAGECSRADQRIINRPRPGHADLSGAIKYNQTDMRNILERASARETAARVAAGTFFKKLLEGFNIYIYSQVISIGNVRAIYTEVNPGNINQIREAIEVSQVRCCDSAAEKEMVELIDMARANGESLGGSFEVGAIGVPPGLGSYVSWDRRLDSQIAGLMMSIPAIKAVEIGAGINNTTVPGSMVHDEIFYDVKQGIYRKTNRAGGIEGGISNGETVWTRGYMKPIPTLYKPLTSVNTLDWEEETAVIERSDICAVPAAAVVGEAMLAYGLAGAIVEKFGSDTFSQMQEAYTCYRDYMKKVWKWEKI
ncbi:MAG: chorismate synthase [Syntrophomonadaceae bacterium]|nr:chorismate synthase [Syntrophomonadaceae bacterium]MDD3890099.1 chorismate synthase [Syntrophomonadaceae bacterium]MDD4548788.1 chorismate synthase [Syntrophomonadaceae bacterium]